MATYTKFFDFTEQLVRGNHDFDAHTFKVLLTNTAPLQTNTVRADVTEITAGNGYLAGGATTTISLSEIGGVTTVNGTQVVFTASGGPIGPFRYAVLYNDTATSPAKPLLAFWDYGSSITLQDTESITIRFSNASPGAIFQLS